MLDQIFNEEVPVDKVSWWIDINEKQCIAGYQYTDISRLIEVVAHSLGIQTHEEKMNKIIGRYNELYHSGRISDAESCLSEYLHGISLSGKVQLFLNIVCGKFKDTKLISPAKTIEGKLKDPLLTHMHCPLDHFYECKQITINNDIFTIANGFVFHRGDKGDAHVIWIWKNEELVHTIGGLIGAFGLEVFWDSNDNVIYILYDSEKERYEDKKYICSDILTSITTVENPNGQVVCSDFKYVG